MRSPARAILWQFQRRIGWGVSLYLVYLLVLGTGSIVEPTYAIRLNPPDGTASLVIVPLVIVCFYLVAVFSFGGSGDIGARESIYPARMFALPVSAAALAGWPMLYGSSIIIGVWLTTALYARWWWRVDLPLVWPALLLAAFLAWTQALTWMAYGWRGIRVVVTVLCLVALDAVVIGATHFDVPDLLLIAFLSPQVPLAFVVARIAIQRARRGDVPDWRVSGWHRPVVAQSARPGHFASAARAQLWYEWRQHGWSLPAWIAILLPFELAPLLVARPEAPSLIVYVILSILLTPPLMASFAGATVSRTLSARADSSGISSFHATRPLASPTLVGARLQMAWWSVLSAWLLIAMSLPLALMLTGTWPIVAEFAHEWIDAVGIPRTMVVVMLASITLLLSTWKALIQGLIVGFGGRTWVAQTAVLLALALLVVVGPLCQWIIDNDSAQAALWDTLPWILAIAAGLKLLTAAGIIDRLWTLRLFPDHTLLAIAAGWLTGVLLLHGVLVWLIDTPLFPSYILTLIAILLVPLVRPVAAPTLLAWNRHR